MILSKIVDVMKGRIAEESSEATERRRGEYSGRVAPVIDPNSWPLPQLFETLAAGPRLERLLALAREEDLGGAGDVTSASIVAPDAVGVGRLVSRSAGVVAGLAAVPAVLSAFAASCMFEALGRDGERCRAEEVLGTLRGTLRSILAVERTLLNLMGRLSGIASLTRRYADAVAGTRAAIYDTRKTTPGLRALEKYAVRCGGGRLHRMGLDQAALYKDNHLAGIDRDVLAERLAAAIRRARASTDLLFVEVEVDSLEQLDCILGMERGLVDLVLLDNMGPPTLTRAVAMRDALGSAIGLEASGGITLETVAAVAESGVDRIAVGGLTHSAPALDIGLEVVWS
jgi:nicotinate-nucleotide pyrophosphorylase (carboxylating)